MTTTYKEYFEKIEKAQTIIKPKTIYFKLSAILEDLNDIEFSKEDLKLIEKMVPKYEND